MIEDAAVWIVAGAIVWYVARGLTPDALVRHIRQADLKLFLAANLTSFLIWWLGDTYLFARLFSFFHGPCRFREVVAPSAAQYFLQAVNVAVAAGALVLFLNRRKQVPWLTATWTVVFQSLVDGIALALLFVVVSLLWPKSPVGWSLPYASLALLFLLLVALWWHRGKPRTRLGRWLYTRPGLHAFRTAGWHEYLVLGGIRLATFVPQSVLYYYQLRSFDALVPFNIVVALTPAMLLVVNTPFTPSGVGPLQAVIVDGMRRFAPHGRLLAASLAISAMQLLCRLPLGVGAAGTFARKVMRPGLEPQAPLPESSMHAHDCL